MSNNQPVSFRPARTYAPKWLKGYSGDDSTPPVPAGIPHGTEIVMASVQSPRIGHAVIETLYYDGDASGAGYLHFRVTANGVTLPYDWADSYVAVGQSSLPAVIAEEVPAGALIEIRCKNEHPSDDTLKAYCDGTVAFYDGAI